MNMVWTNLSLVDVKMATVQVFEFLGQQTVQLDFFQSVHYNIWPKEPSFDDHRTKSSIHDILVRIWTWMDLFWVVLANLARETFFTTSYNDFLFSEIF